MTSHDLNYSAGGQRMLGQLFTPEGTQAEPRPGILVIHGAAGLVPHITSCAERISGLGYTALAVDLWGDRRTLSGSEIGETLGRFASDRAMWMERMEAARAALAAQPGVDADRIGAVGYCFGGSSALEFLRSGGALRAAVSFHGGLDMVADDWSGAPPGSQAMICTGAEDPMAKPSDLARLQGAMTEAGVLWEVDLYSHAKHAFTEPDRPNGPRFAAYDARADRRSWRAMRGFLDEVFA